MKVNQSAPDRRFAAKQRVASAALATVFLFEVGTAEAQLPPVPPGAMTPNPQCAPEVTARNEALVRAATVAPPSSPNGIDAKIAPDYQQHSPEIVWFAELNGMSTDDARVYLQKNGRSLKGYKPRMAPPGPGQPMDNMLFRVVAQCDAVVAVGQHWHANPHDPSKYYATYFFNMWRIRDGRLAEHWDATDLPSPLPAYLDEPVGKSGPQDHAPPPPSTNDRPNR